MSEQSRTVPAPPSNESALAPDAGIDTELATVEVLPVVVVSRVFAARPSSIPEIREFVRDCLMRAPLTPAEQREVDVTVSAALLEAAGPTGALEITFRIFPEHAEVDVLRVVTGAEDYPDGRPDGRPDGLGRGLGRGVRPAGGPAGESFSVWMAAVMDREGLTHLAAARRLGVSVKTISRWVGGTTEPRLRDLRRIREVFGPTPFG